MRSNDNLFFRCLVLLRQTLRLLVFISCAAFGTLVCSFVELFLWSISKVFRSPDVHKKAQYIQKHIVRSSFMCLASAAGIEVNIDPNADEIDESQNYLVLSNHVSYLDVLVIAYLLPASYLAKREVGTWPLIGQLCRFIRCVFVERECVMDRVRAIYRTAKVSHSTSICVFPEGTTTDSIFPKKEGDWHPGNLAALKMNPEIKLILVGVGYEDHQEISWWGPSTPFLPHLLKVFGRKNTKAYLNYKVIEPNHQKIADQGGLRNFAKACREDVASLCQSLPPHQNESIAELSQVSFQLASERNPQVVQP